MFLRLEDVSHNFGSQYLFYDVNISIYDNDKIALIGPNGSGKTTLLNILNSELEPIEGNVIKNKDLNIAFLKQFRIEKPYESLFNFVKEGVVGAIDELLVDKTVKSILKGLGFDEETWDREVSSLSGGELTRLSLGRTLAGVSDSENRNFLLLLDEPTNHLDIYSIKWLENFLKRFRGAMILVSHDRNFITGLCNKYWEINNEKIWEFKGNYDQYLELRQNLVYSTEARKKNLEKEIERTEKMAERFRKWATEKMVRQAILRERILEKLKKEYEEISAMVDQKAIKIRIPEPERTGYSVVKVKDLRFGYGENEILKNINFEVSECEKVAILGKNGCGKSTLLNILTEKLVPTSGLIEWGHNIKVGFLDQVISSFDKSADILNETWKIVRAWPDYEVRKYLGRFGFVGEDVFKSIRDLSGGELTRLALAKILLTKPNVLILDEPTNHLDILTVQTLEETLKEFAGSIILVSHDEKLLRTISDRFVFIKDGISETSLEIDEFINDIKGDTFKLQKKENESSAASIRSWEEAKKIKNRKKSLETKLTKIHHEAEKIFDSLDKIEKDLITFGNNYTKITELMTDKERFEIRLGEIEIEEKTINEELKSIREME